MKKILALTLAAAACFALLTGCGSSASSTKSAGASAAASQSAAASTPAASGDTVKLKVGATPAPHAEILEQVKPLLAERASTWRSSSTMTTTPPTTLWRTAPWTPTTSSTSPT